MIVRLKAGESIKRQRVTPWFEESYTAVITVQKIASAHPTASVSPVTTPSITNLVGITLDNKEREIALGLIDSLAKLLHDSNCDAEIASLRHKLL
jgi:hypothetical protein